MEKQQHLILRIIIGYIILVLFVTIKNVLSNDIIQQKQENLESNQGLYSASDLVFILNETNFKSSVYNSKKAWLVEFYNSWCGFCQRFAPIWKSLAKSVYGWRHIVSIAAINCANDDNNPLCREYEIMKYPTLKFFPINSNKDFLGLEIQEDKNEILSMQRLINQLQKEQQEQRGGSKWPNLVPYWGSEIDILWHGAPNDVQYQILIFEKPKSYLGAEVILDLHKLDTIRIRRVTSENEFLCVTSKVKKFPSVLVVDKINSHVFLKITAITRTGIREAIIKFLKSKGISIDIKENIIEELYDQHSSKLVLINRNVTIEPNNSNDKLYQLDLDNTLHFSLNNEIPLSLNIFGEKLKALQLYLNILIDYFPVYFPKRKVYLQTLKELVESKSNISGKEFREHVKTMEQGFIHSGLKMWIGCKGSLITYRGYPCGLWTMFHTLTVAAAEFDNNINHNNSSILQIIYGYVKNFFGCADCAKHFQNMSSKRKLFEVHGGNESILWLWKAHNEVNKRLAGDATEDPEHKKIQYPSVENCPKCKLSNQEWNENEVLKYLKKKYSKLNIDFQGINNKLVQFEVPTSAINLSVNHHKFGWDFTIFDISICVVLYVTSAAILTLVCIKFAFKRTHKKKILFQKVFGLV